MVCAASPVQWLVLMRGRLAPLWLAGLGLGTCSRPRSEASAGVASSTTTPSQLADNRFCFVSLPQPRILVFEVAPLAPCRLRPVALNDSSRRPAETLLRGALMAETDLEALVGSQLAGAITKKGYTALTAVQEAVLDPALAGRDLRISSQTGSGKTVAIGLTVREIVGGESASSPKGAARPRALVVAPTRELAKQVEVELSWLYASMRINVASVTGGGNFRDERRALGSNPGIVVGTPGRLLDHLTRGSIDGTNLGAVVLDEADRMLDLGFRDDLEAILKFAPDGHRTHLVSATFPREVMALANRVQNDPARIEGTPIGAANTDIEHLVHLVLPHERLDAIVNLLLETPGATTLIFARTRADVGELTHLLGEAGFEVDALSGEMEQRERNKALAAFKRGALDALVATDVAARGIDVQDVTRVLHAEPPMDPDSYTHRSGRTGRAGRKGKSSVLVTPPALNRVSGLLKRAGVRWRIDAVPTAQTIEAAREERLIAALTTVAPPEDPAEEPAETPVGPPEADDKSWALAKRIVEMGEGTRALARMIARTRASGPEARSITVINPQGQAARKKPWEERNDRGDRGGTEGRPFADHRTFGEPRGLRPERAQSDHESERMPRREPGPPRTPRDAATDAGSWVQFRISWGQIHGADARRLLAMACRRGGIRGNDVGAIKVARTFSTIDVSASAAEVFERATREPDPRDPRVKIRPASEGGFDGPSGDRSPPAPVQADRVSRAAAPKSERVIEVERPSKTAARSERVIDVERPSKTAERPSKTAGRTADRASKVEDRSSKTVARAAKSSPALEPERPSKRTLVMDRPSRTARAARDSEVDVEIVAKAESAAPADRPSKTALAPEPTERPDLAERPSPSAYADRRPRPAQPERYTTRTAPKAGSRPSADTRPRPSNDGPRREYDRARPPPSQDRGRPPQGGPRPPFDRSRPRPEGSRPPYEGNRPPRDDQRPPYDGPRSGGPRPGGPRPQGGTGGPRPTHGGPRPAHPGQRPSGPPRPRQGDAPPKRKKP